MANFQYKNGAVWTDIPTMALPDDESGSIRMIYPEPTDVDGNGAPCGIVGLPVIEIGAAWMRGDGFDFWQDFFASETAETASIRLQVWNERTATWTKYLGTLVRPTADRVRPGANAAGTQYEGVAIRVYGLTATT